MRRKLLMNALVCLAAFGLQAGAVYYPITVTYDPEYGPDDETVSDFPVLVRIPAASPIYDTAGTDGGNLRFTDSLGLNDYPHEIDTWNTSGESLVWVKIPQLIKDFTFRLYCSGATMTAAKDVWAGYAGVWHMTAAVDATEKDVYKEKHTTMFIPDTFPVTDAPIGVGRGAPTDKPTAVMSSKVWDNDVKQPVQLSNKSVFSVSFWWRPTVPFSSWSSFQWESLIRAGDGANGPWGITPTGNVRQFRIDIGNKNGPTYTIPEAECAEGAWGLYTVVYEGKNVKFYLNGTSRTSSDQSIEPVWGWQGFLGWGGAVGKQDPVTYIVTGDDAGGAIGGDFDECRFYDGTISAKRAAADYATMTSSDFLTIGPSEEEQDIPAGTVARVGVDYFDSFAAAVTASKETGDPIVLMAAGQSWTLSTEGESIDIKLGDFQFEIINGLGDDFYIAKTTDTEPGVTTYTLLKQIKVAAMRNVAVWKSLETRDLADLLPAQVMGLAADGKSAGMFDVKWDVKDITKYDRPGVSEVAGIVTVGGETLPVTAFVRATLSYSDGYHNIAPEASSMVAYAPEKGGYPYVENIHQFTAAYAVTNGLPATAEIGDWCNIPESLDSWTAWKQTGNPYVDVDFTWSEPKTVSRIEVFYASEIIGFFANGQELTPTCLGQNLGTRVKMGGNGCYNECYEFSTPVSIQDLKICFQHENNVCIGEIMIWAEGGPVDVPAPSTSAELVKLEMDGNPVKLAPGVTAYTVPKAKVVTKAEGEANTAVTVLPMAADGTIRLLTLAEDGETTGLYKVRTKSGFAVQIR